MEIRVIGTPAEVAELKDELRFAPWLLVGGDRVRVYLRTEPKPVAVVSEGERRDG